MCACFKGECCCGSHCECEHEGKKHLIVSIILYSLGVLFLVPAILFKYVFNTYSYSIYLEYVFFVIAFIFIAHNTIADMIEEFKEGEIFNEGLLMIIASIAAIVIRDEIEAIILITLSAIGEALEHLDRKRSESQIKDMIDLKTDEVTLENGDIIESALAQIDDIIMIKPGERIPLDSIVVKGNSLIDTKTMTGEPVPVEVSEGSTLISGTLNLNGVIYAKVTKLYSDSTVSKLNKLIEEAKEKKSKSEDFIEKFSRYYTPIIIIISILAFILSYFVFKNDLNTALRNSATMLVISCPCALVISVPLSFYTGLGRASKEGIMVRGSEYLESMSKISEVIFDKTGTLTEGSFVVDSILYQDIDESLALKLLATIESTSTHPIAKVLSETFSKYIDKSLVSDIKEEPGYGLSAKYGERIVYVGGPKMMDKLTISDPDLSSVGTTIYLIVGEMDNHGYSYQRKLKIVLKDKLKDNALEAINYFKANNIKTYMMTGDNEAVASELSNKLSLDGFKASCLPENKIEYLKEHLNNKEGLLAYIGDGMNDAPSLRMSDIGISIGMDSSEEAKEASDVVIYHNDIKKVEDLHKISKYTRKITIMNIIFSLALKVISLVLLSFNLLEFLGSYLMLLGLFMDTGVTLLCILNTIRISKYRLKS